MPVEKKQAFAAEAFEMLKKDAVALVGFTQCNNPQCGRLHAKIATTAALEDKHIMGDNLHYAAWRVLNPDMPQPAALISVSIAHIDGLSEATDGASNAVVSVTGDTKALGPEGVIEGLEILISRLRAEFNVQEDPDANGAYL